MQAKFFHALGFEFIWWVITAIIAYAVLYPITKAVYNFPFLMTNVIFVIVFITFTRYIFLLKHTFLAKRQLIKIGIVFLCIPLLFFLIQELNYFQTFLDERGVEHFLRHLPLPQQEALGGYIRSELLLFGTGSIICTILLPLRMIISVWRTHNKGTV